MESSHNTQSDRRLAFGLAVTVGVAAFASSFIVGGTWLWGLFSIIYCWLVGLQSRALKRSFVVQVPFLLVSAWLEPWNCLVLLVAYSLISPLIGRFSIERTFTLLIGDLIAVGILCLSKPVLNPEIWIGSGLIYLGIRTFTSKHIAKWTGFPLDIGAISGSGAFATAVMFTVVQSTIFYFNRFELGVALIAQLTLTSLSWIAICRAYQVANETFVSGLVSIGNLLSYAHPYTGGHSRRVAYLARETGRRLGIAEWKLDHVVQAALLHDIGKLAVDERILEKPGRLTDEEFTVIKTHPVVGEKIVASISEIGALSTWIRHHHERVDGKGYPDGIPHREIPIESRLICVIDAYDAMTGSSADGHRRLYRDPVSSDSALEELKRCAGTQFDPAVVNAFSRVVNASQKEDR